MTFDRYAARTAASVVYCLAMLGLSGPAHSGVPFKVYSPVVEQGEVEIEYRAFTGFDKDEDLDGGQVHILGLGYGVTNWWFAEVEFEFEKEADEDTGLRFEAVEFENVFQFNRPGDSWATFGLFAEYEHTPRSGSADEVTLAPIIQIETGRVVSTGNFLLTRELGPDTRDAVEFSYAVQSVWRLQPSFQPAIQAFGAIGRLDKPEAWADQQHYIGPAALGEFRLGNSSAKLKYDAGVLFGLTSASSTVGLRGILELELRF